MAYEDVDERTRIPNGANGGAHADEDPDQLEARLEHTRAEIDDTLAALERKLSPGELLDEALGYVRTFAPGEFVMNLATEVRNRPLPSALSAVGAAWLTKRTTNVAVALARRPLPTALTALGIAWFVMESRRSSGPWSNDWDDENVERWSRERDWAGSRSRDSSSGRIHEMGQKLEDSYERARSSVSDFAEGTRSTVQQAAESARSSVQEVSESARSGMREAAGSMREGWQHGRAAVSSAASGVMEAASSAASAIGERVSEAAESFGSAARSVTHEASDAFENVRGTIRGSEAREQITRTARDLGERSRVAAGELEATMRAHPLVTAFLIISAGAVTAAMLPTTRREDEIFGSTRESLSEGAYDTVREQLELGKRVATAAVEGATQAATEALHGGEQQPGQSQQSSQGPTSQQSQGQQESFSQESPGAPRGSTRQPGAEETSYGRQGSPQSPGQGRETSAPYQRGDEPNRGESYRSGQSQPSRAAYESQQGHASSRNPQQQRGASERSEQERREQRDKGSRR